MDPSEGKGSAGLGFGAAMPSIAIFVIGAAIFEGKETLVRVGQWIGFESFSAQGKMMLVHAGKEGKGKENKPR